MSKKQRIEIDFILKKQYVTILLGTVLYLGAAPLSACGIKPDRLSPPETAKDSLSAPEKERMENFPNTYPDPDTL